MRGMMIAGAAAIALAAGSGAWAQKVESTAKANRAGSEETGGLTLEQIAALPTDIAPLPVAFKVAAPKILAFMPRIAIPSYSVGFIRTGEARASASGFGSSMVQRSSKIETYLAGIDDAALTALTEEAYQDLVARLTAAGIEVVPAAEMQGRPEFRNLKQQAALTGGSGQIDGRSKKGWTTHSPTTIGVLSGLGFNPTPTGAMSTIGVSMALGKFSKAANAVILAPQLGIDYADFESTGNRTWGGSATVSAETRFAINARSKVATLYGIGPSVNPGDMIMREAVGTAEPFAVLDHVQDKSDSVSLATAFATMGLGNMYNQRNVYAVRVDQARYTALVRAAYRGFNQAIVDEVKKARGIG